MDNRFKDKHSKTNGKQTKLGSQLQNLLVELLASISDIGFSLTRSETLGVVNTYIKQNKKQALFPASGPSKEWYKSFMNRHCDKLNSKYSNNMPLNRALAMNPSLFDYWFRMLKEIYEKYDLNDKPTHIFNCDESGFTSSSGHALVVCRKSGKALRLATSNEKNMTTILACIGADGVHMPPHILYKAKRRQHSWMVGGPKGNFDQILINNH